MCLRRSWKGRGAGELALWHPPRRHPSSSPHGRRSPRAMGADPPHSPPCQDWHHTHVQDEGAPCHPVNGFVQQRCGERGGVSSRRDPGPSPTRESQHRIPWGQGGETRCPETPPQVFMEPWASIWAPFCTEPVTAGPPPYCQEQEKPELGWCVEQGQSPVVPRGQGTMGTPIPPPCPPPFCCHRSQRAKPDTPS